MKATTYIKDHTHICAAIGSALVLVAILLCACALTCCSSDTAVGSMDAEDAVANVANEATDDIDAMTGNPQGEPSESDAESTQADQNAVVEAEDTRSVGIEPASSSKGGASVSSGSSQPAQATSESSASSSQPSAQKKWVEDTKKVWVEDRAAWTEGVPVYGTKEVSICNVCGADITGNTAAHSKAHMLAGEGSGHHSEVQKVVTGYNTVNHPAEGHYETKVIGGHWE